METAAADHAAFHPTAEELARALDDVRQAPLDAGPLSMIVVRPGAGERAELPHARLDPAHGVVGDTWLGRGSRHTPDGSAEVDRQVTLMNQRAAAAVAGARDRWALAGDQLYVDLDLGEANLPAGTLLRVGGAVVEVTEKPHRGCAKFAARFGRDALRWVNSDEGRTLNLRGVNARVVQAGDVRLGDEVRKLAR